MRTTHAVVQIAQILMTDPDTRHWGRETQKRAGIRSGTLYPVMWRMLEAGWLSDGWEDAGEARAQKRPPRRYYELTPAGKAELAALLESARTEARFRALFAQ